MSTIIDALKRSDRERQINTTHTMSYSHLNTEENQNKIWIKYALITLLLTVACIVAITFWFNRDTAETNPIEILTPENNAADVISPKAEIVEVVAPVLETSEPAVTNVPIPAVKNSALASIVQAVPENGTQPTVDDSRSSLSDLVIIPLAKNNSSKASFETQADVGVTQAPSAQPQQERVVQINDFLGYDNYSTIRSSQNLPEMHLDILMYHPDSSQRKAFINMSAYREGEQISEGAEILTIGAKGVLLRYEGKDFVLSTN